MQTKELKQKNGEITSPGKMTIINLGNELHFFTDVIDIEDRLEAGKVYELSFGKSITLAPAEPLSLPAKIYDFDKSFREQILTTLRYPSANNNVGVLLEGYKGQGKSLQATQLAIESRLPVIIINTPIDKGYDFIRFLNGIKQDYVLLIDEFEKLFQKKYDSESKFHDQSAFLSFLSGTTPVPHKRLVIITTNEEVNEFFINRPGRMRYYKKYNYMDQGVFDAIIEDKLEDKQFKQDLLDNIDINNCTIDILATIIEEINIQQKPYSDFKEHFNHKEKHTVYSRYRLEADGKWRYIDEVSSSKEFTPNNEHYMYSVIGHSIKVVSNTSKGIIYKQKDYEKSQYVRNDTDDDDDAGLYMDYTFKLVKDTLLKAALAF